MTLRRFWKLRAAARWTEPIVEVTHWYIIAWEVRWYDDVAAEYVTRYFEAGDKGSRACVAWMAMASFLATPDATFTIQRWNVVWDHVVYEELCPRCRQLRLQTLESTSLERFRSGGR